MLGDAELRRARPLLTSCWDLRSWSSCSTEALAARISSCAAKSLLCNQAFSTTAFLQLSSELHVALGDAGKAREGEANGEEAPRESCQISRAPSK